jgi:hypothetical protein
VDERDHLLDATSGGVPGEVDGVAAVHDQGGVGWVVLAAGGQLNGGVGAGGRPGRPIGTGWSDRGGLTHDGGP